MAIILSVVSCRKEEIIPIDETTWEDPKNIDGLYFKGIVTDLEQNIADALIEVYQNEEKVGEIRSREDGSFDTRDIKLEEGSHVTFNILYETYLPRAKRITATEKITDMGKVILGKPENLPISVSELENPGSNDLIVISGYVTTPLNQPVSGVVIGLLYDIVEISPIDISIEGAIVFTDEAGYYEALLPKDQQFEYLVQQNGCTSKILNDFDFYILGGLPIERVGPFNENTELPTKTNADVPSAKVVTGLKLNAQFLNCDNLPIQNGRVDYSIEIDGVKRNFSDRIFSGIWIHDTIYFCINPLTNDLPVKIEIKVFDNQTRNTSDDLEINITFDQPTLGDIIVCNAPPVAKSLLSLFIKNQYHTLTIGTDNDPKNTFIRQDTLFAPNAVNIQGGSVSFFIPNYLNNTNLALHDLKFILDGEEYESVSPIGLFTPGIRVNNSITGFVNTGYLKNISTGEIIEIKFGQGTVNIFY